MIKQILQLKVDKEMDNEIEKFEEDKYTYSEDDITRWIKLLEIAREFKDVDPNSLSLDENKEIASLMVRKLEGLYGCSERRTL